MTGGYRLPTTGVCWAFKTYPHPRGFDLGRCIESASDPSLVRPGYTTLSRSTCRFDTTGGYLLPTTGVSWSLNTCPAPRGFEPIESAFDPFLVRPGYTTLRAFPENHRPSLPETETSSSMLLDSESCRKMEKKIGEHAASSSAKTSIPKKKTEVSESDSTLAVTGVWWDLNTCPVTDGYEPGGVRQCIESELRKFSGEACRVIIYAVGNLEYVSPEHMEAISSSGIIVKHTPCGHKNLAHLLHKWSKLTPPPAKILLISSNPTWFDSTLVRPGCTAIRAFPENHRPSFPSYYTRIGEEWDWETLLKENSDKSVEETSLRMVIDVHVYGPTYYCYVCDTISNSCSSFVRHLKSREHRKELFVFVTLEEKGVPVRYCPLCEYPGYDNNNMNIHYNSDEHKQNEMKKSRIGEPATTTSRPILPPAWVWGSLQGMVSDGSSSSGI